MERIETFCYTRQLCSFPCFGPFEVAFGNSLLTIAFQALNPHCDISKKGIVLSLVTGFWLQWFVILWTMKKYDCALLKMRIVRINMTVIGLYHVFALAATIYSLFAVPPVDGECF